MQKRFYPWLYLAAACSLTQQVNAQTWDNAAGGDWSVAANWMPATVPNSTTASVTFGPVILAPQTITLMFAPLSPQVNAMTFNNANSYNIGNPGEGPIQLVGTMPSITVTAVGGGHQIDANLDIQSPLTVALSNSLLINGDITGTASMTVNGGSALLLLGTNTGFSGSMAITGPSTTVSVGAAGALGSGSISMTDGTLLTTVPFSSASAFTLNSLETISLNGNAVSLTGSIGGAGSLHIHDLIGGAVLTLTGMNNYGGGTVLNSSGPGITLSGTTNSIQGNITFTVTGAAGVSSIVTLTQPFSGTYAGNLSSSVPAQPGIVNLQGGQTFTFTGSNTAFTGTTNLAAGTTLNIGAANALAPGTLTMGGGSTLQAGVAFTSASAITLTGSNTIDTNGNQTSLSGVISGVGGSLTKIGAGTLILTGANTYNGGTTVSAGTLQGDTTSLQGNIALASGTTLTFNQTALGPNYTGNITSSTASAGALVIQGGSTVTMSGNNSGFSGTTIVTALSTLDLASATALGSGAVTLSTGTLQNSFAGLTIPNTVTLTGMNTITASASPTTVSGSIGGTGSLTTNGGILILTGTNNYSGPTTVSTGTLQGNTSSLQGAIAITVGAFLTFDQTTPGTSSSVFTGGGTLNVSGISTLTLSGNSSAFAGPTTIASGSTLNITGNLQTSSVIVNGGATLSGTGTVGPTTNSGALTPGPSGASTLSVNGALTFMGAPTFDIGFTATTSDAVNATGLATLAGDVVITPFLGSTFFGASHTYTILNASSLASTFNPTVLSTNSQFSGSLAYTLTSVELTIKALNPFANFPFANRNERAVGENIDAISSAGTISADMIDVINALAGQDDAVVNNALDQLHPANLSAFAELQTELGGQLLSTFHRTPSVTCFCNKPNRIWVAPFGNWLREQQRNIQTGFHTHTWGVAFGLDHQFLDVWTLGVGGAYNTSHVTWAKDRGHSYISSLYGAIYSDLVIDHFYLGLSGYGGKDWYSTMRHIGFTTIDRQAISHPTGADAGGQLSTAYLFGGSIYLLYPYANLDYLYLHNDAFTERKARSLNLNVDTYMSSTLRGETGVAFQWSDTNYTETFCLVPFFSVAYVFEVPLYRSDYVARFRDQTTPFRTFGWDERWNLIQGRFGLKWVYKCIFLDMQYGVEAAFDNGTMLLNQRANFRFGAPF